MSRSTSFYYSFLVLPPSKRRAIVAVFDFCRAVDDSVDLATDPGQAAAALDEWRKEVDLVFSAGTPRSAEGRQLQLFSRSFHLCREEFDALIEGVAMDATPRGYATFADLEPYCHRVASAVGLVCVRIFGYRDPAVREYARDLGVALQLTNILRDVGVDFRRGHIYLPVEDLTRCGCSIDDIRVEVDHAGKGLRNDRMRAVLEHQAARARMFFSRAAASLPLDETPNLVAAEIMRAIYWEMLQRIEAAGCDVFSDVIRVPRPEQARIAIATWWKARRAGRR